MAGAFELLPSRSDPQRLGPQNRSKRGFYKGFVSNAASVVCLARIGLFVETHGPDADWKTAPRTLDAQLLPIQLLSRHLVGKNQHILECGLAQILPRFCLLKKSGCSRKLSGSRVWHCSRLVQTVDEVGSVSVRKFGPIFKHTVHKGKLWRVGKSCLQCVQKWQIPAWDLLHCRQLLLTARRSPQGSDLLLKGNQAW